MINVYLTQGRPMVQLEPSKFRLLTPEKDYITWGLRTTFHRIHSINNSNKVIKVYNDVKDSVELIAVELIDINFYHEDGIWIHGIDNLHKIKKIKKIKKIIENE